MRSPCSATRSLACAHVLCVLAGATPSVLRAQAELADLTATPEEAAGLFLRSVRAIRWSAAAQFVHPETLDRFRTTITLMSDADASGEVREYLTDTDSATYATLGADEVFERAIGAMVDDMPGLMHAFYDRDDEILGHVPEGDTVAHVVYRTTGRISGAVPEIEVMQLRRTAGGWRVMWSRELEVLDAALRGIPRISPARPATVRGPSDARLVPFLHSGGGSVVRCVAERTGTRPWKSLRRSPFAT